MNLLTFNHIIGGDWPYYFYEQLKEFFIPFLWNPNWPTGLGGNQTLILPLKLYLQIPVAFLVNYLAIPWEIIERVFWFWAFFIISAFSSYYLSRSLLGSLIYTFNTWALMIVSGGQMGIALSYAIAPLILAKFIQLFNNIKIKVSCAKHIYESIVTSLIFSLQILWDFRIAYITILALLTYFLVLLFGERTDRKPFLKSSILIIVLMSLVVTGCLAFWVLPLLLNGFGGSQFYNGTFTGIPAIQFFSFANFSDTISLLHANWPDNIFGKIYFMRSEFIVLPILAFLSLFFLENTTSKIRNQSSNLTIIFFVLLSLVGAFLAKGANPPFGGVYVWLFEHMPGFIMFRDPTKFYFLVAVSYSVLIPHTLMKLHTKVNVLFKNRIKNRTMYVKSCLILAFVAYWCWLNSPIWTGQIGGTFKSREIPQEYVELKDFLYDQPNFFRTFWVPQTQRFGFSSNNHSQISAADVIPISSSSANVAWLKSDEAKKQLSRWSIKYVIVPYDSEGEIFQDDRKYNNQKRIDMIKQIEDINWLEKVDAVDNNSNNEIVIFDTGFYQEHFFIDVDEKVKTQLHWSTINPTKYIISIEHASPFTLIFAESYDKKWVASIGNEKIYSKATSDGLNSFFMNKTGNFTAIVEYEPQKYLKLGLMISFLVVVLSTIGLVKLRHNE